MNAQLNKAMKDADEKFVKEMEKPVPTRISAKENVRGEILMEAGKLITGDRAEQYGNFRDQMTSVADMHNALHHGLPRENRTAAQDVAEILQLLKMRRSLTATDKDSEVDLCGYTALKAEAFK